MISDSALLTLADRNRQRRERKERATPGPWVWELSEDDPAWEIELEYGDREAHLISYSNVYSPNGEQNGPGLWPCLVLGCARRKSGNSYPKSRDREFIAEARNDPVEDDIDLLLAEVRRLRGEETDGKAIQERR
jgi:hypothetical protein